MVPIHLVFILGAHLVVLRDHFSLCTSGSTWGILWYDRDQTQVSWVSSLMSCPTVLWLRPQSHSYLCFQVHYNVGKNLADKGNQTAAIRYYREAVRYARVGDPFRTGVPVPSHRADELLWSVWVSKHCNLSA